MNEYEQRLRKATERLINARIGEAHNTYGPDPAQDEELAAAYKEWDEALEMYFHASRLEGSRLAFEWKKSRETEPSCDACTGGSTGHFCSAHSWHRG